MACTDSGYKKKEEEASALLPPLDSNWYFWLEFVPIAFSPIGSQKRNGDRYNARCHKEKDDEHIPPGSKNSRHRLENRLQQSDRRNKCDDKRKDREDVACTGEPLSEFRLEYYWINYDPDERYVHRQNNSVADAVCLPTTSRL